jgi:putative ABC transport system ATP-binding protein
MHPVRETTAQAPSGAPRAAVEAIDVRKALALGRERVAILNGISLRIERGEFVAISGPSGSGKSTLLGILAGLDQPTAGQVVVNGVDITRASEARLARVRNASIGMVFQSFNLIPT